MQDDKDQNSPGWVFKPGDSPTPTTSEPAAPAGLGQTAVQEATQPSVPSTPSPATPGQAAMPPVPAQQLPDAGRPHVEWSASEYIANPKSFGWFVILGIASVVLAAVVYIITKDVVSTVVMAILGIIIGIFAARQPQVLQYAVDNSGIHVGQKFYQYESFKWFSVVNSHGMGYIYLMPLKRFMPPLTIHYDPSDEDKIADTLAEYLPYEDYKPDVVDDITRRFRF